MGPCKDCKYWREARPEQPTEYGTCCRLPPVIFGRESAQPVTWAMTVCGEFSKRARYEVGADD